MNDHDEDEDFKRIAIDMDDDKGLSKPPTGPGSDPDDDDEPTLTLEMELVPTEGQALSFQKEFPADDHEGYLFLEPDDLEEFDQALPWLSVLSLAGARTFSDRGRLVLFADPQGSWIDLWFQELPSAVADADYGRLIWRVYSSIRLWLKYTATGEVLKELILVAPDREEGGEYEPGQPHW